MSAKPSPADSLSRLTVAGLVAALGDKTPAPGGGAVAPIAAALGAAAARMVVNYSAGRPKLAAHADLHDEALSKLQSLADRALTLADDDARAYAALNDLMKKPKDDAARLRGWDGAVEGAIAVPVAVLDLCLELLGLLATLPGATSRMLASDLAIGAILSEAGACAAAWNIRANLPLVADPRTRDALQVEMEAKVNQAGRHRAAIEAACRGEG